MTTTADTTLQAPNQEADRLSQGLARVFETLHAGDDVFTEDAFFDLMPPKWRFQMKGRDAFAQQMGLVQGGTSLVEIIRTLPTATGFVTEQITHAEVDGENLSARRVWICEVTDGLISDVTCYCNGDWDDELRARHAADAPMLRP